MDDESPLLQIGVFLSICLAAVLWWIAAPFGSTFWFGPVIVAVFIVIVLLIAPKQVVKERESVFLMGLGASWVNLFVMLIVKAEFAKPEMNHESWLLGLLAAFPAALFLLGLAGQMINSILERRRKR